jgi:glycosyltransferase involved in cell wall biosynthesis
MIRLTLVHACIRGGLVVYHAALRVARWVGRSRRPLDAAGCHVLLTGTFRSDAWVEHHLRPLAGSSGCRRVTFVAASPMTPIEKVAVIVPPRWVLSTLGSAGGRLVVFALVALRDRPDIVGGFHLLFNGLAAAIVAPLAGARSMYFCVGGPAEVLDGGILAENRLFNALQTPDAAIEGLLVRALRSFDFIITMGRGARDFIGARVPGADLHVIPGGLDLGLYRPSDRPPSTDIIFVGRLAPIKRLPLLLEAVAAVRARLGTVSLTIVGDGPLRASLEDAARTLGLDECVTFAGHRADVRDVLSRARVFALTSQSEGVSLSLMEALACGVPAVVPRVGDLDDVLADGVNGFLVDDQTPQGFADRLVDLLSDERLRERFADAARRSAEAYGVEAIRRRWDFVLQPVKESPGAIDAEGDPIVTRSARHA